MIMVRGMKRTASKKINIVIGSVADFPNTSTVIDNAIIAWVLKEAVVPLVPYSPGSSLNVQREIARPSTELEIPPAK